MVVRVAEKSGSLLMVLVRYAAVLESIRPCATQSGWVVEGTSDGGRERNADLSATATSAARDLSPGMRALHERNFALLILSVRSTPERCSATSLSPLTRAASSICSN